MTLIEALRIYRDKKRAANRLAAAMAEAQAVIKAAALAGEPLPAVTGISVSPVDGYTSPTVNAKALVELLNELESSAPATIAKIRALIGEKNVSPTVRINVS